MSVCFKSAHFAVDCTNSKDFDFSLVITWAKFQLPLFGFTSVTLGNGGAPSICIVTAPAGELELNLD